MVTRHSPRVPNPQLDEEQVRQAHALLAEIRGRIQALAGGDADLVFAYRRKVAKELTYDERGKPGLRRRLKRQVAKRQAGRCAACQEPLPARGSVLDRKEAKEGYTLENVDLVCRACDAIRQGTAGFS